MTRDRANKIILAVLTCLIGAGIFGLVEKIKAASWVEPLAPPESTTINSEAAPLVTSSLSQYKSGSLSLGSQNLPDATTRLLVGGNALITGNLQVPSGYTAVGSAAQGKQICLNGSCVGSWDQAIDQNVLKLQIGATPGTAQTGFVSIAAQNSQDWAIKGQAGIPPQAGQQPYGLYGVSSTSIINNSYGVYGEVVGGSHDHPHVAIEGLSNIDQGYAGYFIGSVGIGIYPNNDPLPTNDSLEMGTQDSPGSICFWVEGRPVCRNQWSGDTAWSSQTFQGREVAYTVDSTSQVIIGSPTVNTSPFIINPVRQAVVVGAPVDGTPWDATCGDGICNDDEQKPDESKGQDNVQPYCFKDCGGGADTTPPHNVMDFVAGPGIKQVLLSWTDSWDSDYVGVRLMYSEIEDHYARSPIIGADPNVHFLADVTGNPGVSGQQWVHRFKASPPALPNTPLEPGKHYYYAAFAYDNAGNYAPGAFAYGVPENWSNPGESCPYLYVWDGAKYVIDNDILPYGDTQLLGEYTDFYHLERTPQPKDGYYQFKLKEIPGEISYLDTLNLMTVDHSADTEVAPDPEGQLWTYRDLVQPSQAIDNQGSDRLKTISGWDEDYLGLAKNSYLDLEFPRDKIDIKNGVRLILRTDAISLTGNPQDVILATKLPPATGDGSLLIQVPDKNQNWQTVSEIIHPHAFWDRWAIDLTKYLKDTKGDYKVRIYWTHYHKLDFVGLDNSVQEKISVNYLVPEKATHSYDGEVKKSVSLSDNQYSRMIYGDELELFYKKTRRVDAKRDFIFVSEGYLDNVDFPSYWRRDNLNTILDDYTKITSFYRPYAIGSE